MMVVSLTVTGIGKLGISLLGKTKWSESMECTGKWTIWMSRNNGRWIEGMDDGDGSAETFDRGESQVIHSHWIFSGQIGQ